LTLEVVHHKDGDCTNDILDNLEIIDSYKHTSIHGGSNCKSPKIVTLKCSHCNCEFELIEKIVRARLKQSKSGNLYCSQDCHYDDRSSRIFLGWEES
jgi:hypothetical protein